MNGKNKWSIDSQKEFPLRLGTKKINDNLIKMEESFTVS